MIGKSNSSGGSNFFMDDVKTKVREVKISTNIFNPEIVTYGNYTGQTYKYDVSTVEYHGLLYILAPYSSKATLLSYDGTTFTVVHTFDYLYNYYSMAVLDDVIHCFISGDSLSGKHFTFDGETFTEMSDFPIVGTSVTPSTTSWRAVIVSYNEKLYYFNPMVSMYVYDDGTWTQLGSEHKDLKLFTYYVFDRYIYCISSTGNLYKYDGTTFSLVCSITLEDTYPLLFGFNGRLFLFSKTKVYVFTGSSFREVYFEYNSNIYKTQYGHIVGYKDKILIMHMNDTQNLLEYDVFYSLEMK